MNRATVDPLVWHGATGAYKPWPVSVFCVCGGSHPVMQAEALAVLVAKVTWKSEIANTFVLWGVDN
eukprot:4655793-Amphidinium_carterae.1